MKPEISCTSITTPGQILVFPCVQIAFWNFFMQYEVVEVSTKMLDLPLYIVQLELEDPERFA